MLPELSNDTKLKSFWERPEGTTGMIIGIPMAIAALYGLYKLLPYMIILMQNAVTAVALGAGLFAMLYVLFDPRFRNLLWFAYKGIMRALTRLFIEIDPIGILKNYVADLKSNAAEMNQQIANLRGQMQKLAGVISANQKQREDALKMMQAAQKSEKRAVMVLKARKAGRLGESNMTLQNLHDKMELLYRVLLKMYETCLVLVEDLEDEVDVKSREREMINASYSAYKRAMRIVQGDKDKREIFDQTMEFLAEDYGRKLGEIEHFMTISKGFIESVDLQNGIYEEEALKLLEEWENKGESLLLGNQKQLLIAQSADPMQILDLGKAPERELVPVNRERKPDVAAKYADLFGDEKK